MTAKRFYYGALIVGMLVSAWLIGYSQALRNHDHLPPPRCMGGTSSIGPVLIQGGKVIEPKPHVTLYPKGCKP